MNENKKSYIGFIILIIGIILLISEIILCGFWLLNKRCGNSRRKRANELKDDNYDYMPDNDNLNNKKIINEI